ncbi:helix-turn-helix transcriptional regulator [Actinocrispum wychmicini]|uniref:helix-turn-helix transcriptional regulator n=1 Tax=Actinocrispum wychmicini TaxID=1213861 RepID=UPI001A9D911A|nr:helix-turn-helix transcriptional regulator [Actinocrispum wychmicini]
MIRDARQEVLFAAAGVPRHIGARVVEAVRSGTCLPQVEVRMLWPPCDEDEQCQIREMVRHRAQVRIAKNGGHESLLIDRRVAVVPADRQDSAGVLLAVTTPSLVTALVETFTQRWATAASWATVCGQPDEFEQSVLRHMVAGKTDDAVAGKLGVSARTVRRHVTMLMERVGARSRFELGYRAAEFGWLTSNLVPGMRDPASCEVLERAPAGAGCRASCRGLDH